jgi:hypothetical protein
VLSTLLTVLQGACHQFSQTSSSISVDILACFVEMKQQVPGEGVAQASTGCLVGTVVAIAIASIAVF